jgi:hypothetical protein
MGVEDFVMTIKEFANKLDGRETGLETTREELALAEELGFVIVYGASDDLMEFEGAIHDEFCCYDGGTVHLDKEGLFNTYCDDKDCPYQKNVSPEHKAIKAIWDGGNGYAWKYETDIPHECFDIFEDGEKYCRGIVFEIKHLERQPQQGWVPVSERVPETDGRYLCTTYSGRVVIRGYNARAKEFSVLDHGNDAIAWQPLPPRFEQKKGDNENV